MEATTLSAAAAADLRVLCGPRFDTFTVRVDDGEEADRFFRPDRRDTRCDDGDRWDGVE